MTARSARFAWLALCLASPGAWAVDYGAVLSSTPVYAPVARAQRQCVNEPIVYQAPNSGVGALVGAIAGAAVGNSFGGGAGRAVATGLGMVAGAAIGDRIEADGSAPVASTAQRCRDVVVSENRLIGYDVVYDYQGVRRSARLAQDPGERIALDVVATPTGMLPPAGPALAAPVYLTPADTVYEVAPPQVVYRPAPSVYVNVAPLPYLVIGGVVGGYVGGYGGGYGGRAVYGGDGWRGGHGHGRRY